MNTLTLNAYAKINLHLEIVGKREDGYHLIESLMHSISLCDILRFERCHSGIALTCSDPTLSCGEDNLVLRAADAFFKESGIEQGVNIHLIKRIPSQAGMGGGSSDAATTLRGLQILFDSPISPDKLFQIAATLGADVPFCLFGQSAIASGIGTSLSLAPSLPPCRLIIGLGKADKMSTKDAYARLDAIPYIPETMNALLKSLKDANLDAICQSLFNRFTVLNPTAQQGMRLLSSLGAKATLLCGSGAAFFGIFDKDADTTAIEEAMQNEGYLTFSAYPIG